MNVDARRAELYERAAELDAAIAVELVKAAEIHREKAGLELMLAGIYERRAATS